MSIVILLLLFLVVGISFRFNHRVGWGLTGLALLYTLIIGNGFFSSYWINCLQAPYPALEAPVWGKKTAIVLLGASTAHSPYSTVLYPTVLAYPRIYETVRLFFLCQSNHAVCQILISGGDPAHHHQSEAVVYQRVLLALGIPKKDIFLEPKSNNTFQNAQFSSAILTTHAFDTVVLVTSGFHMKRALLYFKYFHISANPAPSDFLNDAPTFFPNSYHFFITDLIWHEYAGLAQFFIYTFFGWNKN